MELVDIGANLTHESFTADRAAVIGRAVAAGVTRHVVTGADLETSKEAAALAHGYPATLWSTAGVHPHHAGRFDMGVRDGLIQLLELRQVVAVGECGLDYYRNFSTPAAQRAAFAAQLDIAVTAAKPVFLHQREAHQDFVAILEEFRGRIHGVAHCFTGNIAQLEDYLALGLSIGLTGWVCDERRGGELRAAVPWIPAERLMIETDAPYLLPRDLRPKPKHRRNEPAYLTHIAQAVADLRGDTLSNVAAVSTRNAVALFGLTPRGVAAPAFTDS